MFQIEREANAIAKRTRRGKGNMLICSSDVASALQMAGVLDYTPALNSNNLQVDDTGATFAGVLNGRIKVYIDPYTTGNYLTVGYKGASAFDAGLFYCPYVPLQMVTQLRKWLLNHISRILQELILTSFKSIDLQIEDELTPFGFIDNGSDEETFVADNIVWSTDRNLPWKIDKDS